MLKYVNTGIVFQEIPDEVTLAINISNCPCRCPGCHSRYLPKGVNQLAQYIHETYPMFKVAWYSGRIRISSSIRKTDFDYIKIGPFIKHLGPLKEPTTNQRLYRLGENGEFEDITSRFWKR